MLLAVPVPLLRAMNDMPACHGLLGAPHIPHHALLPTDHCSWRITTMCWWAQLLAGLRRRRRWDSLPRVLAIAQWPWTSTLCMRPEPLQGAGRGASTAPAPRARVMCMRWAAAVQLCLTLFQPCLTLCAAGPAAVHPHAGRAGAVPRHGRRYRPAGALPAGALRPG